MKKLIGVCAAALFVAGCADSATTVTPRGGANTPAVPAAAQSDGAALSPENTRIEFVGTHVGDKPDPKSRKGTFEKFTGKIEADAGAKVLKSVVLEIDAASVSTEIQKLTDHLKSTDFFEVREYPTIRFESTRIEAAGEGQQNITGKLTLHGVTKEITVPATVEIGDQGLTLRSQFDINRSEFNMEYRPDQVDDKVSLTVAVDEKNWPHGQ